jgi:hypothetical protein
LVAGVGVELSSRRRNKLAGRTSKVEWNGRSLALGVKIHEALGCGFFARRIGAGY